MCSSESRIKLGTHALGSRPSLHILRVFVPLVLSRPLVGQGREMGTVGLVLAALHPETVENRGGQDSEDQGCVEKDLLVTSKVRVRAGAKHSLTLPLCAYGLES
jgi:hypothetical protein